MAVVNKENRAAGILWMLATMFCFIALDAIMKHLMESYSLVQVTWARFFFATLIAALACGKDIGRLARTRHPKTQLLRSVLLMSTTAMFNAGIRTTPLATGTTIMFLNPILVTILAIPLLGEKVGLRRWMGVLLEDPDLVLALEPDHARLKALDAKVGACALYEDTAAAPAPPEESCAAGHTSTHSPAPSTDNGS